MSVSCKDGGVLLASGFPRDGGMETSDNSETVQTYRTSHTCKGISSRSSRVIPLKRAKEVVVHGDGSCTRFVDVRGHDEELDVHGIFEGRR